MVSPLTHEELTCVNLPATSSMGAMVVANPLVGVMEHNVHDASAHLPAVNWPDAVALKDQAVNSTEKVAVILSDNRWTEAEDELLMIEYMNHKHKWIKETSISKSLPGHSISAIRNHLNYVVKSSNPRRSHFLE